MGNDNSTPLPPPPSDQLSYFTITFSGSEMGVRDSLYLNYCRESEVKDILEAARESWPPGVKFHKTMVEYGYRIKLNGQPFQEVVMGYQSESVWTRTFLATMFLKLGRKGWIPYVPSDLRRFGDTVSVFMRYDPSSAIAFANSSALAVVGLHDSDKMQFINVDGGLGQLLYDVVAKAWHNDVSMKVFPDYNRNFGGAKWFKFCEEKFCPDTTNCDKERMLCCTHSYCPYSGASGGGAARRYNQILLDYCITPNYTVSICCSPCTCQLSPLINRDMSIQTYKGMPTLFEHSCERCAAAKSRMQPCTCQDSKETRPVAILGSCDATSRPQSHGRILDDQHFKSCRGDSWDPMRGRPGIGG